MEEAIQMLLTASLREISLRAPHVPGYFENLMYICSLQYFPGISKWFEEEVDAIIRGGEEAKRWSELLQMAIIQGAQRQIPPLTEADTRRWHQLMRLPRYSNIAFFTLAPTPLQQLELIQEWWDNNPQYPDQTFRRVVRHGMRHEERERFIQRLKRMGATWDIEVRMRFNHALEKENYSAVFPPVSEPAEA